MAGTEMIEFEYPDEENVGIFPLTPVVPESPQATTRASKRKTDDEEGGNGTKYQCYETSSDNVSL